MSFLPLPSATGRNRSWCSPGVLKLTLAKATSWICLTRRRSTKSRSSKRRRNTVRSRMSLVIITNASYPSPHASIENPVGSMVPTWDLLFQQLVCGVMAQGYHDCADSEIRSLVNGLWIPSVVASISQQSNLLSRDVLEYEYCQDAAESRVQEPLRYGSCLMLMLWAYGLRGRVQHSIVEHTFLMDG